jgi:Tol biopolymer transport system component
MTFSGWMTGVALAAFLSVPAAAAQPQDKAEVAFRAAMEKETVDGDLKGAIEQYKKLAQNNNKSVAARALVRLGECYEKQGNAEARKTYEQVLSKFGDQKEAVEQARARLAALGGTPGAGGVETRMLWQDGAAEVKGVSADGRLVVLIRWDTGDLAVRDVVAGTTRNVTNKGSWRQSGEFAEEPVISADGQMAVYSWYTGKGKEVRSINTDGTGMRRHIPQPGSANALYPVAVSPDKKTVILKSAGGNSFQVLSLTDNSLKPFGDGLNNLNGVSFSPDSKHVVIALRTGPPGSGHDLFLANADGTGVRPLLAEEGNDNQPFWSADGKQIVFCSDRTGSRSLWAIPATGGAPRLLKKDIGDAWPLGLTRDGSLYYTMSVNEQDVQVAQLDLATLSVRAGPSRFINTFLGRNKWPSISPDGQWVAWLSDRTGGGNWEQRLSVIVRPVVGGEERTLPVKQHGNRIVGPRWFPDSRAVLLGRTEGDQMILERVEVADGRRTEIYRGKSTGPPNWRSALVTPDGKAVVWLRRGATTESSRDLVRYELDTRSETVQALGEIGAYLFTPPAISPDGKWLAFAAPPRPGPGDFGLFVMPAVGGKPVELARSTEGAVIAGYAGVAWTPDSKHILYLVQQVSGGERGEFRGVPIEGGTPKVIPLNGRAPTFHPDGRLAYSASKGWTELWLISNLPGM